MATLIPPERVRHLATPYEGLQVIHAQDASHLSRDWACSLRDVQLAALAAGVIPLRYARNVGTIGAEGQARLLQSTVTIVGLGGLGGYISEALARMGVGRLVLIDTDVFEEHNLNRQLVSTESNQGAAKALEAAKRVQSVNSAVEATALVARLAPENVNEMLCGSDVVVDALDRLPIRLTLQKGAQALGIPMVHGSIAGFIGQVMTIFPDDDGLFALYGSDENAVPEQGMEAVIGTPAATPMAVAAWEAQEVVKVLTGIGRPLRNRLLILDMETGSVETIHVGVPD
ncbi:MAG: HesA/MoeB/ThiF family protein [Chloroflexi bacterium]|nr:HesA/MoeB/ThiF family protein [Chloroflexota bacterium]